MPRRALSLGPLSSVCLSVSLPLHIVLAAGCEPSPPAGFEPPPDAVARPVPPGAVPVWVTRTENPLVEGRAPLRLARMTVERFPSSGLWVEEMRYQPDGVRVRSAGFTDGSTARYGWLDIEARAPGGGIVADLVINWPFLAPSISLPFGGRPVELTLETVRGQQATDFPPGSIPPPLGFDVAEVDRVQLVLDATVLVLPVRITVFTDMNGQMPYLRGSQDFARDALRQWLDPGAATEISAARTADPFESKVMVHVARNDLFEDIAPDGVWTQCGIQLHLEELQIVSQPDGLERILVAETSPCGIPPRPLSDYFPPGGEVDRHGALPIFVGGQITTMLLGDEAGGTCGAFSRCVPSPRAGHDYIILDGFLAFERVRWALAHELGHILGLGHEGAQACEGALEPTNLMLAGGPAVATLPEATLGAAQCRRARCLAAGFLEQWGSVPAARREAECAGL